MPLKPDEIRIEFTINTRTGIITAPRFVEGNYDRDYVKALDLLSVKEKKAVEKAERVGRKHA